MKFKIFEEDTRYKLEKELNDFAKNNEIQHIREFSCSEIGGYGTNQ